MLHYCNSYMSAGSSIHLNPDMLHSRRNSLGTENFSCDYSHSQMREWLFRLSLSWPCVPPLLLWSLPLSFYVSASVPAFLSTLSPIKLNDGAVSARGGRWGGSGWLTLQAGGFSKQCSDFHPLFRLRGWSNNRPIFSKWITFTAWILIEFEGCARVSLFLEDRLTVRPLQPFRRCVHCVPRTVSCSHLALRPLQHKASSSNSWNKLPSC